MRAINKDTTLKICRTNKTDELQKKFLGRSIYDEIIDTTPLDIYNNDNKKNFNYIKANKQNL